VRLLHVLRNNYWWL